VSATFADAVQRPTLLCFYGTMPLIVLQDSFDDQSGRADDQRAVFAEESRIDDGLGNSRLVFQGEEHESFGRAGALADDHRPRRGYPAAVGKLLQIERGDDVVPLQARSEM